MHHSTTSLVRGPPIGCQNPRVDLCWHNIQLSDGEFLKVSMAGSGWRRPRWRDRGGGEGHRRPLIPALMRPPVVIVGRVFGQDGSQVRLIDDEDLVEALLA